jgi:hypothetical protein
MSMGYHFFNINEFKFQKYISGKIISDSIMLKYMNKESCDRIPYKIGESQK